jgi:hypothetical protein
MQAQRSPCFNRVLRERGELLTSNFDHSYVFRSTGTAEYRRLQ